MKRSRFHVACVVGFSSVICLFALGHPAFATTYYVRKTGSDFNNGKSKTSAFKTVNKATATAKEDDTIWVGSGTYSESVTFANHGKSGKTIKLYSDTTGANTGDVGQAIISSSSTALNLNKNYIEFAGIEFRGNTSNWGLWNSDEDESVGTTPAANCSSCTGVSFTGCEFINASDGIKILNSGVALNGCTVQNNYYNGIYIEGTSTVTVDASVIQNCGRRGVYVKRAISAILQDCMITDNYSHGIRTESSTSSDILEVRRCGVYLNRKDGIHIHGNSQILLENCGVVYNQIKGVHRHSGGGTLTVNHCTCAYNSDDGLSHDTSSPCNVKNSIFAYNQEDGIDNNGSNFTHSYNLSYSNTGSEWEGTTMTVGCKSGNPLFVSYADFHLNPGSAAIDAGTGSLDHAIDLTPRPIGNAVDMGCYEGLGGGPPPPDEATEYYVRVTGNDSKNGKSAANAFRTLTKAATVVGPGDTVWVGAGAYPGTVDLSSLVGTLAAPIKFIADLDGAKTGDAGTVSVTSGGFYASSSEHLTLEGFTISVGGTRPAWATSDAAVYLSGCASITLDGLTSTGGANGIAAWTSTNILAMGCNVSGASNHGLALFSGSSGNFANCSSTGNTLAGFYSNSAIVQISGCTAANNGSRGYQLLTSQGGMSNSSSTSDGMAGEFSGSTTDRTKLAITNFLINSSDSNALKLNDCTVQATGGANPICSSGSYAAQIDNSSLTLINATVNSTQYGVQASGASAVQLNNCTFTGCSSDGVYFSGGSATIANSTFTNCNRGVRGVGNGTLTATSTTVNNASTWAIEHTGFGSLTECVANNCNRGFYLIGAADRGDITLTDITVQGTTREGLAATRCVGNVIAGANPFSGGGDYGIYLLDSELTATNPQIAAAEYGVLAYSSTLTLSGASIANCSEDGIFTDATTATVSNTTISNCNHGIRSEGAGTLVASQCTISGSDLWGVHHSGFGSLTGCLISNNAKGVYLVGDSTRGDVTVADLVIQGTSQEGLSVTRCTGDVDGGATPLSNGGGYGAYLSDSDMSFSGIQIDGADYGIMAYSSVLTVTDASITDCGTDGVYANQSTSTLTDVSIARCDNGINSQSNSTLNLSSGTIEDCTVWGVAHTGYGSIVNSTIADCSKGMYLIGVSQPTDIQVSGTVIQGTSLDGLVAIYSSGTLIAGSAPFSQGGTYGAYLSNAQFQLSGVTITGPERGVVALNSSIGLSGSTVQNTTQAGVYAEGSTVILSNNQITGCGTRGIDCQLNSNVTLSNCVVQNCGDWGLAVTGTGTIDNCQLNGNASGANLVGQTTRGDLQLQGLVINNCAGAGLVAVRCEGSVQGGANPFSQGGAIGLDANDSELVVTSANLSGSTTGVRTNSSRLTLRDVRVTGVTDGLYSTSDELLTLERVRFENCSGLALRQEQGESQLKNCLLVNVGSGLYFEDPVQAKIWNATVVCTSGNGLHQVGGTVDVRNTIFHGNNAGVGMLRTSGSSTTANNLVYGFATSFSGVSPDTNTLVKNPQFTNLASGDYTLAMGSPAINAGVDLVSEVDADIAGNPRPTKNRWEIGAYESLLEGASLRVLEWAEKK